MARHTYLADLFRSGGLTVHEGRNWKTTGADRFAPAGIIEHSTVTGTNVSDERVAELLRVGRPDLAGPLSQWGTGRDGAVWLAAAGRANHNGYGYGGNDRFGNEMFNDGYGEPHPEAQLYSSHVQAALLCRYHNWPSSAVLGHKESDARRKIDPRNINMHGFRLQVLEYITHGIGDNDMTPDESQMLKRLHDTFCGDQPSSEGSPTKRVHKVLDNALWTSERITAATDMAEAAKDEAHTAVVLATSCDRRLAALMDHFGIELPADPT
jgi:hypothetical protein